MSQIRSNYAKCLITWVTGTLTLIPLNDVADDLLQDAFDTDGAFTTIAITQADSGRGGYGETTGPYKNFACAISS